MRETDEERRCRNKNYTQKQKLNSAWKIPEVFMEAMTLKDEQDLSGFSEDPGWEASQTEQVSRGLHPPNLQGLAGEEGMYCFGWEWGAGIRESRAAGGGHWTESGRASVTWAGSMATTVWAEG